MLLRFGSVLVLLAAVSGCGSDKKGGGGGWTPETLLAAAEDTANRICACPDTECLGKIEMEAGKDPLFGHSTMDYAEKLPADVKAKWDGFRRKGMQCKVDTINKSK